MLGVLRPAESAVRRLIVIAAAVVVKLAALAADFAPNGGGRSARVGEAPPSFQLFDPPKRVKPIRAEKSAGLNRASISSNTISGMIPRWPPCFQCAVPGRSRSRPPPDGLASATRLHRRLQALKLALEDLPRQAKRLRACRRGGRASPWPKSTITAPVRPSAGLPPEAHSRGR